MLLPLHRLVACQNGYVGHRFEEKFNAQFENHDKDRTVGEFQTREKLKCLKQETTKNKI